jgi:cell division protein FtsQ
MSDSKRVRTWSLPKRSSSQPKTKRRSAQQSSSASAGGSPTVVMTRAEEIRRQRTKAKTRTLHQHKPAKIGPPTPPPIMVRGSLSGPQPAQSKRTQRARRSYNIALGSQGAEMRLPALPRVRIGWRLASFLVAGLLIFGIYQLWNLPIYRVNQVEIHGLQRLSSSAVSDVLEASDKPVFILDEQIMQQNLLTSFPELSTAAVTIELPNTVVVTVTERVPVLIWRQDGKTSLVDIDGMIFPFRDETVQTNYPVVEAAGIPPMPPQSTPDTTGNAAEAQNPASASFASTGFPGASFALLPQYLTSARPFLFPEMVSAILSMAENAPEGATLIYDSTHGLGWQDRRGWYVYFGDILNLRNGDMETKLRVYKSILEYLKLQDTKPSLISVEFVHAPYYRLAGDE